MDLTDCYLSAALSERDSNGRTWSCQSNLPRWC